MSPDVSIIIVTYNSEQEIEECLRSVESERQGISQEIIVLDNNSKDRTVKIIEEKFPTVRIIRPGSNLGFAAGVNHATKQSTADYLLLLNPDTIIRKHAIDEIVKFARIHPKNGLYGGRTLKADGTLEPSSCWGLPSLWSLAMFAFGLSTIAKRNPVMDPESLGKWERDSVREVGVITGCFLLISRKVWVELQGFDERFFMYGEDTDLAVRARHKGYHSIICPFAQLIHDVGQSSPTPLHKARLLYRGKATYVRTHWRGLRQRVGLYLLVFGVGLRAVPGVFSKRCNQVWLGLWKERSNWLSGYGKSEKRAAPVETASMA